MIIEIRVQNNNISCFHESLLRPKRKQVTHCKAVYYRSSAALVISFSLKSLCFVLVNKQHKYSLMITLVIVYFTYTDDQPKIF